MERPMGIEKTSEGLVLQLSLLGRRLRLSIGKSNYTEGYIFSVYFIPAVLSVRQRVRSMLLNELSVS
jgi:hypothetical protein